MIKHIIFYFSLSFLGISLSGYAQDSVRDDGKEVVISGKVLSSSDNSPLPGVAVVVKGTSIGGITDINGDYSISVPAGAEALVFTFMGYETKEVAIDGKSSINISLDESTDVLEEIIVSGAASATPLKKMSFAVAKLSSKNISQVPAPTAAGALQGKIPGVSVTSATGNPGNAPAIRLRGSTSLLGSQAPLYIVDGVYLYGTLADIGANDIENIEVIKGASGSSLYGSRAGNGVIVWNSYRGTNLDAGETKIRIRNEFGISSLARELPLSRYHNFKLASDASSVSNYTKYEGVTYDADGNVTAGTRQIDDDDYADNPYTVYKNHQADFFKPGSFFTNYISAAHKSGSGKTNLYASFENNQQEGIVFGTKGFSRQSFRFNMDHELSDKFRLRTSNYVATSKNSNPPGGVQSSAGGAGQGTGGSGSVFYSLLFIRPDVKLDALNTDGTKYKINADPWSNEENPLYPLQYATNNLVRERLMSNVALIYSPVDWTDFEVNYSVEKSAETSKEVYPKGYLGEEGSLTGGQLREVRSNMLSETFSATANFNKKINDLTAKLKLSYFWENYKQDYLSTTGTDLAAANITNFAVAKNTNADSREFEIRAINYFGILDIDYKDKYIASFLYRIDGSSLFGADVRYQPYFRGSFAYRLTEDFDINGIDEWKLRVAYGTAGQRPAFNFQYETYSVTAGGGLSKSTIGNSELKPSRSSELEIGTNIEFLKRFKFELNYVVTNTDDVFGPSPLSASTGYSAQYRNIGSIRSNVIEFGISANIIDKDDFSLEASIVFDRVRQDITKLSVAPFQVGPDNAFFLEEGANFGTIYGKKWITSIDQLTQAQLTRLGKTASDFEVNSDGYVIAKSSDGSSLQGTTGERPIKLDADGDGVDDLVPIGNINPDFTTSLNTWFRYKNLRLYMLWQWNQGGDVYNQTVQWIYREGRHSNFDQAGKADSDKKTATYYNTFYDVSSTNSYFVESGSYVKLRELSVYYDLKRELLTNIGLGFIDKITLGVIGRNLLTFSNYSGYDPEVATPNSDFDQSNYKFDGFGYPNFRTFTGSLQIHF